MRVNAQATIAEAKSFLHSIRFLSCVLVSWNRTQDMTRQFNQKTSTATFCLKFIILFRPRALTTGWSGRRRSWRRATTLTRRQWRRSKLCRPPTTDSPESTTCWCGQADLCRSFRFTLRKLYQLLSYQGPDARVRKSRPRTTYSEIQHLYHSCIKLVGHLLALSFPLWNDCPWIYKVAHNNQLCPSLVQTSKWCCWQAWTKRAYPLAASMKANLRSCIVTISWNKFTELQQLRLLFNGFHHSGLSRLWQRRKMAESWSFGPSWIPSMTSIHTWVKN